MTSLETHLRNTLSADASVRRPSEACIAQLAEQAAQATPLLGYIESSAANADLALRVQAAITFKNYVKRNWPPVDGQESLITDDERVLIKQRLVALMLTSTGGVQAQLGEAISTIGKHDFPAKWEDLLDQLTRFATSNDMTEVISCLQVVNSLIRHYPTETRSNEFWREIIYVIGKVAAPLTVLLTRLCDVAKTSVNGAKAELDPVWQALAIVAQIFYSLNAQDLPEYFEDNMAAWMSAFLELLKLQPPALCNDGDDDAAGPVEKLQTHISESITLYAQRYDEEFSAYLPPFVTTIFELLVNAGAFPKYDVMKAQGIQFLAQVATRPQYATVFEDAATLQKLCEHVIVPNMMLRDDDIELFDDSPDEYMRRDLEGNDVDTRRRASAQLVQALCKLHEAAIFEIFRGYITTTLDQYALNRQTMHAQKEVCIYLVVSLTSRGQTARHGVTAISSLIPIDQFYAQHILPELADADVNAAPILKWVSYAGTECVVRSACVKYVVTYRNQLPPSTTTAALPMCVSLLTSTSVVVRSYAAHAIERICLVRREGRAIVTPELLNEHAAMLYTNLFAMLDTRGTELSDACVKCVMRSMGTLRQYVLPYSEAILARLSAKLAIVAANPSQPHFNHYLFECYCVLIRQVHSASTDRTAAIAQFEAALFPPFTPIIINDVIEFLPYVFQILSMMLELRPVATGIPGPYAELLPFLLKPDLWERSGNHQSLIALLASYIRVGAADMVSAGQVPAVLGVMQKLLSMRSTDYQSFLVLNAIYTYCELAALAECQRGIWSLLFNRLQGSAKTPKFVKGLLVNMCVFICRYGASTFVQQLESIQPGMFAMILEKVMLKEVHKMEGASKGERGLVAVAFTRLLTQSTDAVTAHMQRRELWHAVLRACVQVINDAHTGAHSDSEEDVGDVVQLPETYENVHAALAYAQGDDAVLDVGVPNAHVYLVQELTTLAKPVLFEGLDAELIAKLQNV